MHPQVPLFQSKTGGSFSQQETDLLAAYFSNAPSLLPQYSLNLFASFYQTWKNIFFFVKFCENCWHEKWDPLTSAPKEGKASSTFSVPFQKCQHRATRKHTSELMINCTSLRVTAEHKEVTLYLGQRETWMIIEKKYITFIA